MIELVNDRAAIGRAEALNSRLLDGIKLRQDAVRERGWTTVLLPGHFWGDEESARALSRGLKHLGLGFVEAISVFAVVDSSGNPDYSDYLLRVSSDAQSLYDFAMGHSAYDYLLTTENADFAAVLASDDFMVLSGPTDFLIATIGKDIEQAWDDFNEFALERLREHESLAYFRDLARYYGTWPEA